jgi:ABC-type spermidine/putrescine transport system permease subunit II
LLLANKAIAVGGLALWVWPLCTLILYSGLRPVTGSIMESLHLDGASWLFRGWAVVRLAWRGVAVSVVGVTLVMLGSLVALDVAQVETYSITMLRLLNSRPEAEAVWLASWPLVLIGAVAAWVVLTRLGRERTIHGDDDPPRPRRQERVRVRIVLGALIWLMAVFGPMMLFFMELREPPRPPTLATITRLSAAFWRENARAVATSVKTGAWVGLIGLLAWLAGAYGASLGGRPAQRALRALTRLMLAALVVAGLLPAVLIGSALARVWSGPGWIGRVGETGWVVVLAHAARFGFVPGLIGVWVGAREPGELRDLREIDGASGLSGWARAWAFPNWGAWVGAGLATAILSFHEIEAGVLVRPPGAPNFAQQLLDWLHFSRDDRLAAAAVNVMGFGIIVAYLAGYLLSGTALGRRSAGPDPA